MGTLQNKYKPYQISTLFLLSLYQLITTLNLTRAFPQAPQNDQDLVSFACNHTLYPEICISSLKSDPRTKTASDLKAIASIALDQTATQATQTESYIDELLEKSHGSYGQTNGRSLEDCQEEYSEAVEDLREATAALNHGKYDDVNELVSGAMTDCQTCLDESETW